MSPRSNASARIIIVGGVTFGAGILFFPLSYLFATF
jgi:hypothetical protein